MSSPHQAGNPPSAPGEDLDIDEKLKLIEFSYGEVLDATKHQDDKIGRLLTSIAFLTAATLALAALDSGKYVTHDFAVRPFHIPLALITIAAFLLGVTWCVMLLMSGLSTPLRLPGLDRPGSKSPAIRWANEVKASPIYFYSISQISQDKWKEKWAASLDALKKERMDALVAETHNLGVRTSAKYDRATEAVGILSLALLSFTLSIALIVMAAASPAASDSITLSLFQRIVVGAIFGSYVWLQTLGSLRYQRQAVDEAPDHRKPSGDRRIYRAQLWYTWLLSALITDVLVYDNSSPELALWISSICALTAGCIAAFWNTFPVAPLAAPTAAKRSWAQRWLGPGGTLRSTRVYIEQRLRPLRKGVLFFTVAAVTFAGLAIFLGTEGWYAWQLGLTSLGVVLLMGQGIIRPTLRARHARHRYWKELLQPSPLGAP